MLGRWLPPVLSPVAPSTLARALFSTLAHETGALDDVQRLLSTSLNATSVSLTDTGTSALILAIRQTAPRGGTIALPGYACVDLLAAAAYARVRVRFYDVDPDTLSPDLDSVDRVLDRGANAVVVAHLFGYPADVPGVSALAARRGITVIEDAAQRSGGVLHGVSLGAQAPLVVLSFGRGKGTTGGAGGALILRGGQLSHSTTELNAGWRSWLAMVAQWAAGRPALYGVPASIPALHLGETIYRDAHEPTGMSLTAACLIRRGLTRIDAERTARAHTASLLIDAMRDAPALDIVQPIAGGTSGYLRLIVLDRAARSPAPRLGVVRAYPRPLNEEAAARRLVAPDDAPTPGARTICARLFTIPTHAFVTPADRGNIVRWALSSTV